MKLVKNERVCQYCIIGTVALCCYLNTLFGTFVFDDTEAVVKNKDVTLGTPVSNVFKNDFWGTDITSNLSHKSYRPLATLSYRLNVLISSELNALHFHAVNIFLYVTLCLMCMSVLQLFTGNVESTPFLSCLLFTVHPVHTEVVASIVGRADLFAANLVLLSFLLYDKVINTNSWPNLLLVVVLVSAGTLCKETAITSLCILLVYDWTHSNLKSMIPRGLFLVFSGAVILYLRLRLMNFEGPNFTVADNPAAFSNDTVSRILTYNYVYFINIVLLLWPEWLCFDWSMGCIPLLEHFADFRNVAVILFWMVLLALSFVAYRQLSGRKCNPSVVVALSFVFFPFLPASNLFLKVGFVVAERILLLPSLGFSFLVVHGLKKLSKMLHLRAEVSSVTLYAICAIFALRTVQRNIDWLTEERLFGSALKVCPLNAKVHYNIGKVAADNNRRQFAIEEYRRAIELNPLYEQAMNNLANLLRDERKFTDAEILLRRALEIRPNFAAAWMNLGIVLTNLNRSEEAEQCYLTAISFRNKYPDCYYNLGNLVSKPRAVCLSF
uniref:dolichyl-phosphate-mannose--protein mannosyltransferase n=1 Tax=Photinus pyralis TaxID=7054 RepID=A0A1Y1KDF2_PHOPY